LIPFLNEESSEFIDAIYEKNADNICEELGDLLLQVMLHSEIGYENKEFELNDVIKNLNKKIINRHPYIFNKKEKISLEKSKRIFPIYISAYGLLLCFILGIFLIIYF